MNRNSGGGGKKRSMKTRVVRSLLVFFVLGLSSHTLAQDRPLKRINWGVTTLSASMWIPWVAKGRKSTRKMDSMSNPSCLEDQDKPSQALLGGSLFAAPVALPQVMLPICPEPTWSTLPIQLHPLATS